MAPNVAITTASSTIVCNDNGVWLEARFNTNYNTTSSHIVIVIMNLFTFTYSLTKKQRNTRTSLCLPSNVIILQHRLDVLIG